MTKKQTIITLLAGVLIIALMSASVIFFFRHKNEHFFLKHDDLPPFFMNESTRVYIPDPVF